MHEGKNMGIMGTFKKPTPERVRLPGSVAQCTAKRMTSRVRCGSMASMLVSSRARLVASTPSSAQNAKCAVVQYWQFRAAEIATNIISFSTVGSSP